MFVYGIRIFGDHEILWGLGMKECCATCARQYIIERLDYSGKGCQHSYEQGYACGAVLHDGTVYHMVGNRPEEGFCEMYKSRE